MKIAKHIIVRISLVIRDEEGRLLESTESGRDDVDAGDVDYEEMTEGRRAFEYMQGTDFLLPAVEAALEGREAGEELEIRLSPGEAFGYRDERRRKRVSPALFGDSGIPLQVGETVLLDKGEGSLEGPGGFVDGQEQGEIEWAIEEIHDDYIILDGNNPWAGKTLHICVRVLAVRAATGRELWAGRAIPEGEMMKMGLIGAGVVCGPGCEWC